MYYSSKAYLNARGGPSTLVLTHDIKRCLADSRAPSGYIHILSSYGTTGIKLIENDKTLQDEYLYYIESLFAENKEEKVSRRSYTGANKYHLMAAMVGLDLIIPFEQGRLSSSPFHEIIAFDFEPKEGRREFVMSVFGDQPQAAGGAPGRGMMRR